MFSKFSNFVNVSTMRVEHEQAIDSLVSSVRNVKSNLGTYLRNFGRSPSSDNLSSLVNVPAQCGGHESENAVNVPAQCGGHEQIIAIRNEDVAKETVIRNEDADYENIVRNEEILNEAVRQSPSPYFISNRQALFGLGPNRVLTGHKSTAELNIDENVTVKEVSLEPRKGVKFRKADLDKSGPGKNRNLSFADMTSTTPLVSADLVNFGTHTHQLRREDSTVTSRSERSVTNTSTARRTTDDGRVRAAKPPYGLHLVEGTAAPRNGQRNGQEEVGSQSSEDHTHIDISVPSYVSFYSLYNKAYTTGDLGRNQNLSLILLE